MSRSLSSPPTRGGVFSLPIIKRSETPRDWIIMEASRGDRLVCIRCGTWCKPTMPVDISIFLAMINTFSDNHKNCQPHSEGDICTHCDNRGHGPTICPKNNCTKPEDWLLGPDTGISSKTIWCVMMGKKDFAPMGKYCPSPPLDPSDFGRCDRLLKLFPDWRIRIGEMRNVKGWELLADNWTELETLYEQENRTMLYHQMQRYTGRA